MNIESSGLNALFSATESLDNVQQAQPLDGEVSHEFADTLKDKIRQLKDMHEVADKRDGKEKSVESMGTKLPHTNQLEENIDLEDTLEALENVMNMIDGIVTEELNLEEKLASLVEKLEAIAANIPQSVEWEEKFALVSEKLEKMSSIFSPDEGLENDVLSLEEQARLLENQIQQLTKELESLAKLSGGQKAEEKSFTQLGAQLNMMGSIKNKGREADIKVEALSLKQITEENPASLSTKPVSESLLQQENLLVVAKLNQKAGLLDEMAFEMNQDKSLSKITAGIAQLNQFILPENKTDISPMSKHFAHPEWNKEMGERILWMHKQAVPSAELRLNPRHLGPVTIKLNVTQDQVSVAFTAQHASVKEAIEAAIPKLREMFSAQQLNLADVEVSQDDKQQKQSNGFAQMGSGQRNDDHKELEKMTSTEEVGVMELAEEIEAGRAIASNGILSIFA